MNNIFKALILTAPAMAILFFYIVVKQSEHQALLERESARFDQEFSEMMKPKILGGNESFWKERQEKAQKEEEEAQKRLEEKRKKAEQIEQEFEKAMNETKKEDLEKLLKQK